MRYLPVFVMLMVLIYLFPQGMTAVFTIVFVFSLFAAFAVWLIKYGSKLLKKQFMGYSQQTWREPQFEYIIPASGTYYHLLGVDTTADNQQIKAAYRMMVMKYHPDRIQTQNETERIRANEIFLDIQQAYHTLINPYMRNLYDRTVATTRLVGCDEHVETVETPQNPAGGCFTVWCIVSVFIYLLIFAAHAMKWCTQL